jgi:hypothetical protein
LRKIIFFGSETAIYVFIPIGFLEGGSNYRKSLQPSKKIIPAHQNNNFLFLYAAPDPQHCFSFSQVMYSVLGESEF